MMSRLLETLTKRQRQALALAILALLLLLAFSLTVAPLWAVNRHYMDTIEGLDRRMAVLQRTVSADSELRSQHEQLKRSLARNRHYLQSESEALAAAKLQGIIKQAAGTQNVEVVSTQILPSGKEAGFKRVALKVRTRGRLNDTVRLFYALETGQPYLFLDNVSFSGHARRGRSLNVPYGQMLNVTFDLIGYMAKQS